MGRQIRRWVGAAFVVGIASSGVAALAQVAYTWVSVAPPCELRTVFAAPAVNRSLTQPYFASSCDRVLSDGSDVSLPPLVGLEPKTVSVRNVGVVPITIATPSKADVIDGTVYKMSGPAEPWMPPGFPIVCCGAPSYILQPQQAVTFLASPDVPNSWFTVSTR